MQKKGEYMKKIISIAGGSASGKTTVAKELLKEPKLSKQDMGGG